MLFRAWCASLSQHQQMACLSDIQQAWRFMTCCNWEEGMQPRPHTGLASRCSGEYLHAWPGRTH